MANGWGGRRAGAGRPKGSKNKDTVVVEQKLEEMGCSPLELLAQIAMNDSNALGTDENIAISLRLKAASELAGFLYPRRRSVDATVNEGGSLVDILQTISESADLDKASSSEAS